MKLIHFIKFTIFKKIWRYYNKYNDTMPANKFTFNKVEVGKGTYGYLYVREYGNDGKLKIGNYCSIADKVVFLLGGEHSYDKISTFPFKNYYFDSYDSKSNGDIIIEDDVWIGYDTLVLSGVKIGKGSVIAARSVVSKDIPPYSIYIGNRVYKSRFDLNVVNKLQDIDFSKIDDDFIKNNKEIFETSIDSHNIDEIVNKIKEYTKEKEL